MRSLSLIAVLVFVSTLAAPALADMVDDCQQMGDLLLRLDGCTAVIDSGTHSGGNLAIAFNNRGVVHLIFGDSGLAIEDFDQAVRVDPDYAEAYNNRGIVHTVLGEYRQAIEDHDQALRIDPGYFLAYSGRAVAHKSIGEYDLAAKDWELEIKFLGAATTRGWQKYLKGEGHYSGAIDGIYGPDVQRGLLACARDPSCSGNF